MMRFLFLIAVFGIAACERSPESLGITGPGASPTPTAPEDRISPAGVDPPGGYGPSLGPLPSSNRYFNYN